MAYPLYLPSEARRLFTQDVWLRRVASTAHWSPGARLLELAGSSGGVFLSKELLAPLTVADPDAAALKTFEEKAKGAGLGDRLTTKQVAFDKLGFGPASFDGVLVLGRVLLPIESAPHALRPLLAPKGRLVMTTVVKVGRHPAASMVDAWEKRLGHPLLSPRDVLMAVERQGYEPETIETVSDVDLDELYKDVEPLLAKAPADEAKAVREEIALHRTHAGRAGVSYAAVIARRKEPGEKPPAARDGG